MNEPFSPAIEGRFPMAPSRHLPRRSAEHGGLHLPEVHLGPGRDGRERPHGLARRPWLAVSTRTLIAHRVAIGTVVAAVNVVLLATHVY